MILSVGALFEFYLFKTVGITINGQILGTGGKLNMESRVPTIGNFCRKVLVLVSFFKLK